MVRDLVAVVDMEEMVALESQLIRALELCTLAVVVVDMVVTEVMEIMREEEVFLAVAVAEGGVAQGKTDILLLALLAAAEAAVV